MDLSLTIGKNTTVGFVGITGCGKTTLGDVTWVFSNRKWDVSTLMVPR